MCGIAGCYQQVDGPTLIGAMTDRLAPRGPDDHGLYHFQEGQISVQLAHRRLSIIDLSEGGHQPMTRDGLTLIYNGELYNYRELRAELDSLGVRFQTSSDTEVVLEAWRRWGPAVLPRLQGMFAFAVFDGRSGRLALARDQLGQKPLHYLPRKDGVVFASELKSIVAALGGGMEADPGALIASLLYYWVPPERCAIKGVAKLPPGSWADFYPDGRFTVRRYWAVEEVAAQAAAGPTADLQAVIEASVDAHLVADVPVSTFLSGGLDSSIVSVLAKRRIPDLSAYTITFRPEDQRVEAMPDDAVYARRVARKFGIELHEIDASPDIVELLPRIVDILDEPVGDPAAINTLLMCEAARDAGVKVMLSGMGADELFGGYRKHLACKLAATYRRAPGPLRRGVDGVVDRLPVVAGGRGLRTLRWAKRFLDFAELPEAEAFRRSYTLYDPGELRDLVSPEMGVHVDDVIAEHDAIYHGSSLTDPVDRMCLADTRMFLPGLNLAYTDRASMAASIEVRIPFVDPTVVAAAFSLPSSDKIRGRTTKAALKDAAAAWLPDEIIHRPKSSFGAPLRAWISRDLKTVVDEELLHGEMVASGFLQRGPLERLVEEDRTGREDRSKQIWQLLTTEIWARHARDRGVAV
ncbi:MAG: asparagine synthase (glutamine-hydrolyzing) [Acidimicrobiaceae bacterium]|nr:asparagine synthase (glutamine-hydrolyzing) [Acidimicrobiaceae bacterium]